MCSRTGNYGMCRNKTFLRLFTYKCPHRSILFLRLAACATFHGMASSLLCHVCWTLPH